MIKIIATEIKLHKTFILKMYGRFVIKDVNKMNGTRREHY